MCFSVGRNLLSSRLFEATLILTQPGCSRRMGPALSRTCEHPFSYAAHCYMLYFIRTNLLGPRQTPKQHLPPPPTIHPRPRILRHNPFHQPSLPHNLNLLPGRSSLRFLNRLIRRIYIRPTIRTTTYTLALELQRSIRNLCNASSFLWCIAERESSEG